MKWAHLNVRDPSIMYKYACVNATVKQFQEINNKWMMFNGLISQIVTELKLIL